MEDEDSTEDKDEPPNCMMDPFLLPLNNKKKRETSLISKQDVVDGDADDDVTTLLDAAATMGALATPATCANIHHHAGHPKRQHALI